MRKLLSLFILVLALFGLALAEPVQLNVQFPATSNNEPLSLDVEMDDLWFEKPSGEYDHRIAKLSIGLTVSAFRDKKFDISECDHYVSSLLEQAGFENYRAYGYDKEPTGKSISNGIAMKRLSDDAGEYVLIAVPVCGQGYGDEWLSNFAIGEDINHSGFMLSAEAVYARLKTYIHDNDLTDRRLKVWATGFSRAAAVSNLVGHMLLQDPEFEPDNIFIYTFGTPNNTKDPIPYSQIHNICGSFDPVPKIPFSDWGYGKHGQIHYLPAHESNPFFLSLMPVAEENYRQLLGTDKDFAPLVERNWLIGEVLEMLYQFLPESSLYSHEYQSAVMAAYATKSGMLDRLNAMINALKESHADLTGINRVQSELLALLGLGLSDTMNLMTGNGGSEVWMDLLSSGIMLAHEHFPEEYISWIFSTDDTDQLFAADKRFNRLLISGEVDVRVTSGDRILMDDRIQDLAVTRLGKQMFISLPIGTACQVTLTATDNTRCIVGYSTESLDRIYAPIKSIRPVTLLSGDTLTLNVPDFIGGNTRVSLRMNNRRSLRLVNSEYGGSYARLLSENGSGISDRSRSVVNSAVIMLPWLICSTFLLFYALATLIKRLIRHQVNDLVQCRRAGMTLLIVAAALSVLTVVNQLVTLIMESSTGHVVVLSNPTLQRASAILGLSTKANRIGQMVIYLCMAWLCISSIRHGLSRIRLVRLSLTVLILDIATLFLGSTFASLSLAEGLSVAIPVLSLAGLTSTFSKDDPQHQVGKRWLPVNRAILLTAAIFFLRQAFVYFVGDKNLPAVLMKALSGLPVLLLSLYVLRHRRNSLNQMTLWAICCYFVANTVINLSMPVAMIVYIVGHILLIVAYVREHKPGKIRIFVWALLSVLLSVQLFVTSDSMSLIERCMAVVYIAAIMGVLVSAEKVSRRIQVGSLLFLVSNQLLRLTLMFPGEFLLESVELLLYYVAVIIMVTDPAALMDPTESAKKE